MDLDEMTPDQIKAFGQINNEKQGRLNCPCCKRSFNEFQIVKFGTFKKEASLWIIAIFGSFVLFTFSGLIYTGFFGIINIAALIISYFLATLFTLLGISLPIYAIVYSCLRIVKEPKKVCPYCEIDL